MNSSSGWGGKRKGAGRKPGPNIRVALNLPRDLWADLQTQAQHKNITPEALIIHWLKEKRKD